MFDPSSEAHPPPPPSQGMRHRPLPPTPELRYAPGLPPPPPDLDIYIVKYDYSTDSPDQLSIYKEEKLLMLHKSKDGDWRVGVKSNQEIGWVPISHIAMDYSLERYSWFHGKLSHVTTKLLLEINGSFLVWETEGRFEKYVISLYYNERVISYRIRHSPEISEYYINRRSMFKSIPELLAHYSKNSDGMDYMLLYPVHNKCKFYLGKKNNKL